MTKGCFITGTDTGVGKTMITAALAIALHKRGLRVGVMKPVETGCPLEDGSLQPQDSLFLRKISGCSAPAVVVTPYTFAEPLAPAIAAERARATISIEHIRSCYQQLAAEHDIVLVEGAGGLLVPLTEHLTMHDMSIALDLPLLIVARNILGTINHTWLTFTVASQRSRVLGIVMNHTQPDTHDDLSIQTNVQALRRWVKAPLLGQLPYTLTHTPEALASLGELLAIDRLLESL